MKKIISLILAILMVATLSCALIPVASAADNEAMIFLNGQDIFDGETMSADDAIALAQGDGFSSTLPEGTRPVYTVKLLKNAIIKNSKVFQKDGVDIIIDGKLADGSNATLTTIISSGNGNSFQFIGDAKYIFKNVNVNGSNLNGCLIQVKNKAALDIVDCKITTDREMYFTINTMRDDGGKTYVNIIRSTISQLNPQSGQRAIIGTCNPNDNNHHLVLNIVDSTLASQSPCVLINAGSTGEITAKNSNFEIKNNSASSAIVLEAIVLSDDDRAARAPAETPILNSFTAENCLIKVSEGGKAISVPTAEEQLAGISYTYEAGTPDSSVTTPFDEYDYPELSIDGGSTETTPAPDADTTPAPDADTTPAPDADTTPAADDETTPAGDDVTTAAPAADGGCAGCGGAAAVIPAIIVAMAAAVAIVIKKK